MPKALFAGIAVFFLLGPLFVHAEFYSFQENSSSRLQSPQSLFDEAIQKSHDLLKWTFHSSTRPLPLEKYNRLKHFGTWIDDPKTPECFETRALVLMRDSLSEVQMSSANPCKVYSGEWNDPYGGANLKLAREIEIDHVVALKNAYDSGAWSWDFKQRCLFANFMGFDYHLISSASSENKAKSDRGPEGWMPSDKSYACQHLQNWLAIKFIWNLNMTLIEAQAIEMEIEKNRCQIKDFLFSKREINKIRNYALSNSDLCLQNQ